jgi:hypothetical protein
MVRDSYRKPAQPARSIPKSTMVDIHAETNHRGELSAADLAAVAAISSELNHLGIVRPVETMHGIRSEEELAEVLLEAEGRSLAEEELNPEYHSSRLDEALMGLEGSSNPLMEKFDDYEGLDYNPAFRARDKFDGFLEGSKSKKGRTL